MNASKAIDDLIATLRGIEWLRVLRPGEEPGRGYSVIVAPVGRRAVRHFGAANVVHEIELRLTLTGRVNADDVPVRLGEIEDALLADRRRDGNAQTTVFPEEGGAVEDEDGKHHLTLTTIVEVHTHESEV